MTTRYGRCPPPHIERFATFPRPTLHFAPVRPGSALYPDRGPLGSQGRIPDDDPVPASARWDRLTFDVPHDPRPEVAGEREVSSVMAMEAVPGPGMDRAMSRP